MLIEQSLDDLIGYRKRIVVTWRFQNNLFCEVGLVRDDGCVFIYDEDEDDFVSYLSEGVTDIKYYKIGDPDE